MIKGEKIKLRPMMDQDIDFLFELRNELSLQEMLIVLPMPNSTFKVRKWLQDKFDNSDNMFFVISDLVSNIPYGYIQIINIDLFNKRAEIGVCIIEKYQGMGFFKEAYFLIERFLKYYYSFNKLIAFILKKNLNSITAFKKCGFNEVGILKSHFLVNNVHQDILIMEKIF